MRQRKIITILTALLWVVMASPHLTSALFFSHGHHRISTELTGDALRLVLHHDGKEADHSHSGTENESHTPASSHEHSDNQSEENGDHHVVSLSNTVVISPSSTAYATVKLLPVISVASIFTTLSELSSYEAPKLLYGRVDDVPISTLSRRTIVLLI